MKRLFRKIDSTFIGAQTRAVNTLDRINVFGTSNGDSQFVGATILILVCVVVGALYLGITKTSVVNTMSNISKKISEMLGSFSIG